MTIRPGDPRERYRLRRRFLQALGGLLFLPAQGIFLRLAIEMGSALAWSVWVVVLLGLVAALVVWVRDARWSDLTAVPWTPGPLLIAEGSAIVFGVVLHRVVQ